ncbi:MAG TPA: STAS domain-containing protein [Cellvibrio sp.]|nr:STAS domain-containing protein [Cellvibrio sp.]
MPEIKTLTLPDRFDYSYHRQFSDAYVSLLENAEIAHVVLDFSLVKYLDSSSLGMMVLMQKEMKAKNKKVQIKGARGTTEEILKMANMNKIFEFI